MWRYVYREIDERCQLIDVFVSRPRDIASARRFFIASLVRIPPPAEVITDQAPTLAT